MYSYLRHASQTPHSTHFLQAPQILCGSVKQIGAKYKLHCDQHLQKIREVFKATNAEGVQDFRYKGIGLRWRNGSCGVQKNASEIY